MFGRLTLLAVLLFLLLAFNPLYSQDKPAPPTAIRWDNELPGFSNQPTPGPVPNLYPLGARVAVPFAIDVDEYGRLYVLDHARQELMLFSLTGELEQSWEEGFQESFWAYGREDISVIPGGEIFLGPCAYYNDVRVINSNDGSETVLPHSGGQGNHILALADGSYIIHGPKRAEDARAIGSIVYIYDAQGNQTDSWEAPRSSCMAVGNDASVHLFHADEPKITVYNKDGKLLRDIELKSIKEHFSIWRAAVDNNGDIYFSCHGYIYRLDQQGNPLARWAPYRSADEPAAHLSYLDIAVRNGLIYAVVKVQQPTVTEASNGKPRAWGYDHEAAREIQAFTPEGQCVARYVSKKPPLELPASIAVQKDGNYAVVQFGTNELLMFDSKGKLIEPAPLSGNFEVVIAKRGGGYLAATGYKVVQIDNNGKVETTYEIDINIDPNLMAHQIAVNPADGHVWGLGGRGILMEFDADGRLLQLLEPSKELNHRTFSGGMAIDKNGFIYLANTWRHSILKIGFDGLVHAAWGKEGSGLGEMKFPSSITIDNEGRLYIADTGNSRIQVFSDEGEPIGFWGVKGKGIGQLNRPFNITLGPGNVLWISDTFNDRIVKIPLDDFWKQIKKEIESEPGPVVREKQPIPQPGSVTVTGIVIAGNDDFLDTAYIEDPDRSWGMRITLPEGTYIYRGECCTLSGVLELKERAARHLIVHTIKKDGSHYGVPNPLGMANLYVGDGWRAGRHPVDLSNLGMLIRTWGHVTSVDSDNSMFMINDGSYPQGSGLIVYAANLHQPLDELPEIGQYVAVTGVSITWASDDGQFTPGLRVRNKSDVQIFKER